MDSMILRNALQCTSECDGIIQCVIQFFAPLPATAAAANSILNCICYYETRVKA